MTQRLRAPWWAAWAVLAAVALPGSAAANTQGSASAVGPSASARTDPGDDVPHEAHEELAGSVAGVGREHPGRPADAPADPEAVLAAHPYPHQRPALPPRHEPAVPPPRTVAPSKPATVTAIGTGAHDRAADLAAHLLPLGTGLALMGLGLGYMGVRLRRGL